MLHRRVLALFTVALCLTPSVVRAYELKRTDAGDVLGWREARVTFRVRESAECGPSRDDLLEAARIAADAWRGFEGVPEIVIEGGRPPGTYAVEGENGIYVHCEWAHGSTLAVTVGSHNPADGRMVDADVLVNGEMPIALLSEGHEGRHARDYDIASVLTHEMGHVLGLDESDVRGATMWRAAARGDTSQRTLETDDEDGVIAAYARSASASLEATSGAGGVGGCSSTHVPDGNGGWPLLGVVAGILLFARRTRTPSSKATTRAS